MDMELEECPFCGEPAKLVKDEDHHGQFFSLGCSSAVKHTMDGFHMHCPAVELFYTEEIAYLETAIKLWNNRAITDKMSCEVSSAVADTLLDIQNRLVKLRQGIDELLATEISELEDMVK
jgi:hypothetical protein